MSDSQARALFPGAQFRLGMYVRIGRYSLFTYKYILGTLETMLTDSCIHFMCAKYRLFVNTPVFVPDQCVCKYWSCIRLIAYVWVRNWLSMRAQYIMYMSVVHVLKCPRCSCTYRRYVATSTRKKAMNELTEWQAGEVGGAVKYSWKFSVPKGCRQVRWHFTHKTERIESIGEYQSCMVVSGDENRSDLDVRWWAWSAARAVRPAFPPATRPPLAFGLCFLLSLPLLLRLRRAHTSASILVRIAVYLQTHPKFTAGFGDNRPCRKCHLISVCDLKSNYISFFMMRAIISIFCETNDLVTQVLSDTSNGSAIRQGVGRHHGQRGCLGRQLRGEAGSTDCHCVRLSRDARPRDGAGWAAAG